jgi:hypothetical protein
MQSVPVKRTPSILIVAAKWWHLSARLAAALRSQGCSVSALCPHGHPLAHVRGLEAVYRYSGIKSLASLSRAIEASQPDILVPCDDGVVAQLHALHQGSAPLRDLIERSLGHPDSFSVVSSRYRLLATAAELGIAVAETRRLPAPADLAPWREAIGPSGVIKADGESGGNGVRMCSSPDESRTAWKELRAPISFAATLKRLAIDCDPLAFWRRENLIKPEITGQRIIRGRPANCMAACLNGRVLSVMSVAVLVTDGPTGASMIVRRVREERMELAARRLAERLGMSGFFGLDFIVEDGTDTPILIEMNPRATQLGHLEFADQPSLAAAFSAAWRGETPRTAQKPVPSDTIGLFPQARRAVTSRHHDSSYLDVPSDEPALEAELERDPWPQRRWMARAYHALRPIQQSSLVEYEALATRGREISSPHQRGADQRTWGIRASELPS